LQRREWAGPISAAGKARLDSPADPGQHRMTKWRMPRGVVGSPANFKDTGRASGPTGDIVDQYTITLTEGPDDYESSLTAKLEWTAINLFGPDWAAPLAKLIQVALRTCKRVKAAAEAKEDHPAAEGMLKELRKTLADLAYVSDPTVNDLEYACEDDPLNERTYLSAFVEKMEAQVRSNARSDDGDDQEVMGPYSAQAVGQVLQAARESETWLVMLVRGVTADLNAGGLDEEARRQLLSALGGAVESLGGLAEIRDGCQIHYRKHWEPVFAQRPSYFSKMPMMSEMAVVLYFADTDDLDEAEAALKARRHGLVTTRATFRYRRGAGTGLCGEVP